MSVYLVTWFLIKILARLGGPTRPGNPSIYDQSLFILDYNYDGTVILRCHLDPGIFLQINKSVN